MQKDDEIALQGESEKAQFKVDTAELFSGDHSAGQVAYCEHAETIQAKIAWQKIFAYLAIYIGWGTTYLAIRVGVKSVGPATFLGVRFLIAAAALLPYLLLTAKKSQFTTKSIFHSALQGIMLLIFGLLPTAYAEKTLASNITAIVIGCAPVAFAIFDWLINKTPIRRNVLIGMILGAAGVAFLGFDRPAEGAMSISSLLLVILGMSMWSMASVFSKKMKPVTNPLGNVFVQYMATGILLTLFAVVFEGFNFNVLKSIPHSAMTSLLYIALGPSLISYTSYLWLLKNEPSSRVSTYAFINPIVAVFAGALILKESTGVFVLLALALVICGTWLNFRKN